MKYINTDRLITEIERRKKERREFAQKRGLSSLGNAAQIRANEDEEILSLIISLQQEQPEADFEKELKNERTKLLDAFGSMNGEQCLAIRNFARHFYELDKTARKEE